MSKKSISLFLALIMLLSMFIAAIPAAADDTDTLSLAVTASATEAKRGDTVNFSVKVSSFSDLRGLEFKLLLPDGLTVVEGSSDISSFMNAVKNHESNATGSFNEDTMKMVVYGMEGYSTSGDTVLVTFSCTVNDDAAFTSYAVGFDSDVTSFQKTDKTHYTVNAASATVDVVCAHAHQKKNDDVPATCTKDGYIGATVCDDCGVTLIERETISAPGHDYKVLIDKEPTVDEDGIMHDGIMHKECKVCGDKTESEPFKCLHENTSNVPAKDATCEEAGHGAYTVCDKCGAVVDGSKAEIPALGHEYGDLIEEIAPTCGKDGVAAHYECERCHKLFNSDKKEITEAELVIEKTKNHIWKEEWVSDGTYHWHVCTVCGEVKDKEYHSYVGGVCEDCGMEEPPAPVVVTYTIKAEASEGGSISPAGTTTIVANNDKTYTFTPDKDYVIADVLVDGKSVGAVASYKFANVSGNHTISVVFKWAKFVDVAVNDRYYNAIKYVYQNNLFIGTSDTEFSPNMTMDRSMFATVLCRLAGVTPAEVTKSSFSDAVDGAWYVPYIEWAASEGLMLGYGDGKFGVTDQITIEQAAIIMTRYAEYTGIDVSSDFAFDSYSDADSISEWAVEQMKWVVENGIYIGEGNKLNPADLAKRCQVADIINLYAERFVK